MSLITLNSGGGPAGEARDPRTAGGIFSAQTLLPCLGGSRGWRGVGMGVGVEMFRCCGSGRKVALYEMMELGFCLLRRRLMFLRLLFYFCKTDVYVCCCVS